MIGILHHVEIIGLDTDNYMETLKWVSLNIKNPSYTYSNGYGCATGIYLTSEDRIAFKLKFGL